MGPADTFVVEAPGGRILGIGFPSPSAVYAFDPGRGQFHAIVTAPYSPPGQGVLFRHINTIARLSRFGLTLIGTDNGAFQILGDTVQPWPGATGRDVGSVLSIADLPVHGGVMLAATHGATIRRDDGSVEQLIDTRPGWFSHGDEIVGTAESQQPGQIVAKGVFADWRIQMRPRLAGGFRPDGERMLMPHPDLTDGGVNFVTRAGQYLLLRRATWPEQYALERLDADGLHVVPGGMISGKPTIFESASLKLVLIHGADQWYSYDGEMVRPVQGSQTSTVHGGRPIPTDMPTLGRTFLAAEGLFEFTADNRLVPVTTPDLHGPVQSLAEMPSAGVGLIATPNDLYALSRSGSVLPISDADTDT